MRFIRNKRGTTVIETLVSISLITMVSTALIAMLIGSIKGWCSGTSIDTATNSASIAIQKLGNDIRDAKSASVSGDQLTVTFPTRLTDAVTKETIYNLSGTDPDQRLYYIEDGKLMRKIGANTPTVMMRGVYLPPSPHKLFGALNGEVNVTIEGRQTVGTKESRKLVTARINLRNFRFK